MERARSCEKAVAGGEIVVEVLLQKRRIQRPEIQFVGLVYETPMNISV